LAGGGAYTDTFGRISANSLGMKNQEHHFHFGQATFMPRRRNHKYAYLMNQKKLIEKHFSFLKCQISNKVLRCTGWIQPEGSSRSYKVLIEYVLGKEPKTTILEPDIEPSIHIHMYKDRSLCLSYPSDLRWTERSNVAELTIPWIAEWLVYYELYLVNGNKWEGPQSPVHLTEATRNVNTDEDL
jgi:hypothetical protein